MFGISRAFAADHITVMLIYLTWSGAMDGSARIYSVADYQSGFFIMLAFAAVGVMGALKIQETNCRNISDAQG